MRFLVTQELGRLAKWLRILGFDSLYVSGNNFGSLFIQALRDERIILTKNARLAKARGIKTVLLHSDKIREQLVEVLKTLEIKPDSGRMFTRCIICNVELIQIEKEKIKEKIPPYVFLTQQDFVTCPQCQRIYWPGTHWGNIAKTLEEIIESG